MFTTVTAPCNGTIQEILVSVGSIVETKDLMIRMGR